MTKLRTRTGLKFQCNHEGCKAVLETTWHNHQTAWKRARAAGWKARFEGVRVLHFCGWIHAKAYDAATPAEAREASSRTVSPAASAALSVCAVSTSTPHVK